LQEIGAFSCLAVHQRTVGQHHVDLIATGVLDGLYVPQGQRHIPRTRRKVGHRRDADAGRQQVARLGHKARPHAHGCYRAKAGLSPLAQGGNVGGCVGVVQAG
jgi:hypothetical protein